MKFKSILLSTPAIVITVTATSAADVVMVEPEPMEYLRVCDAYGKGFFFIPGTETCFSIAGYARVEYGVTHIHDGYRQTKYAETGNTYGGLVIGAGWDLSEEGPLGINSFVLGYELCLGHTNGCSADKAPFLNLSNVQPATGVSSSRCVSYRLSKRIVYSSHI
jgi:hypothetical protein